MEISRIVVPCAILSSAFVAACLFKTLSEGVVASMTNPYAPPVDPSKVYRSEKDPKIGASMPEALGKAGSPQIFAVHPACLSCSLTAYEGAKAAFEAKGVVNVVSSDHPDTYASLEKAYPSSRVRVVDESLGKRMNSLSQPRLYAYDAAGRLVYIQGI